MVEYVDIVDEEDTVIDKIERKDADEKVLRMRASKVLVFDANGNLLIHKRSEQQGRVYPGLWDFGAAETVQAGESYESAAIRGVKEELGITIEPEDTFETVCKHNFTGEKTKRIYTIFSLTTEKQVNFDPNEMSEIKFVSQNELLSLLDKLPFVPSAKGTYEKYLEIKKP